MNITELADALRQSEGVISVDVEGEAAVRLRVEFVYDQSAEQWILKLRLIGYLDTVWLPAQCLLLILEK